MPERCHSRPGHNLRWQLARLVTWKVASQLCVPGRYHQIELGLQVVELQLYLLELRADVRRHFTAKIPDAQRTAQNYAEECADKEDQHFPHRPAISAGRVPRLARPNHPSRWSTRYSY